MTQTSAQAASWGLVATIKAEAEQILDFAAWHLEQGAHRLFLYLDAPCPDALPHLRAHSKIRVIETDVAHWQKRRGGVPPKHQARQSLNATRAYRRQAGDVDWLIHLDVDEFLWCGDRIAEVLTALPADTLCARARPLEALAGEAETPADSFKARIPSGPEQDHTTERLYPRFGRNLRGGFVSHVQGKLFVRTGLAPVELRIHNVFVDGAENPGHCELPAVDLCHLHAESWAQWLAQYRYRHQKGSYRAEMAPARRSDPTSCNLHSLFAALEAEQGEAGLRAFFDEVCANSNDLRARLQAEGLLRHRPLARHAARQRQFPQYG